MTHILGRQFVCEPGAKHPAENVVAVVSGATGVGLATLTDGLAFAFARRDRQAEIAGSGRQRTNGDAPVRTRVLEAPVGLGLELLAIARAADWLILVTTTASETLADTYAVLKYISLHDIRVQTGVVVTLAGDARQAETAAARLARTAHTFLGRNVRFLGCVPLDEHLRAAVDDRAQTSRIYPRSPASACIEAICEQLEPVAAPIRRLPAWWSGVASIFL